MKRQKSLIDIDPSISQRDREDLKAMISQHRFFRDNFLSNIVEGELSEGDRMEDRTDFKEYVRSVVARLSMRHYHSGQVVINMHDQGNEMYIVNEGRPSLIQVMWQSSWKSRLSAWTQKRSN